MLVKGTVSQVGTCQDEPMEQCLGLINYCSQTPFTRDAPDNPFLFYILYPAGYRI
jgi:hypothetical protein